MPPEPDGRAKDDELKSLVIYIRNMGKQQPALHLPLHLPTDSAARATRTSLNPN